jgi:hypothetical protein
MNRKQLKDNITATAIGLLTSVVLLEIIFRTVLPAAQLPESTFDDTYRIPKFLPGEGQYTIGKFCAKAGWWHINEQGWNSPYNYIIDNRKKIAIIGDSYIEAFQVDVDKSVGPVLQTFAPEQFQVMSFGTSGAPLSQYLQLSRYISHTFKPEIVVLNLVHNDFDESIAPDNNPNLYLRLYQVNDSTYKECGIEPMKKKSLTSTLLSYTATGRYLMHNLKIQTMQWGKSAPETTDTTAAPVYNANIDVRKVSSMQKQITAATNTICQTLRRELPHTRIIIMMDGLRKEIYEGTSVSQSNIRWMTEMVQHACETQDIEFIDLTNAFAADYQKNKKVFEFPYDWHWNEHGHRIAAQALYQQLTSKTN